MTAADHTEGGGGVNEAAAHTDTGGRTAGIHHVQWIVVPCVGRSSANNAVLGLKDHLNAFRQIVGNHGGQADAQIYQIAVAEFFCHTLGDKAFDFASIHISSLPLQCSPQKCRVCVHPRAG